MTQHGQPAKGGDSHPLAICELLLLLLTELKIISEQDARDVLASVATTHNEAALVSQKPERHRAVVEIVQRMLAGKQGMLQ